jgi:hypothetical protein
MTTPPLNDHVRAVAREALLLASTLTEAEAIQWSPSPVPKPREDTTQRAKGGHGDPTLAIVLDDRRMAVRSAVEAAHAKLAALAEEVRTTREALGEAVDQWNGAA